MTRKNYVTLDMLLDVRPRGPMDKASDFESEDWGFESPRGQIFALVLFHLMFRYKI